MRILYLVHQFFPEFGSGTERVTLNLARAMQRAGHHVQVLGCAVTPGHLPPARACAIDSAEQGLVEGVAVTMLAHGRLPARADTGFDVDEALTAQVEAWLRSERFDLVHVMHSMRMGSAIAAATRAGLPLLLTLTDFFPACVRINLVDLEGRACAGPEQGTACARKCLGPAWSTPALQARYQHARSILERADGRPVLLCIDDIDRLDDTSAVLVHQMVSNGEAKLVATLRTGRIAPGEIIDLGQRGEGLGRVGRVREQVVEQQLLQLDELAIVARSGGGEIGGFIEFDQHWISSYRGNHRKPISICRVEVLARPSGRGGFAMSLESAQMQFSARRTIARRAPARRGRSARPRPWPAPAA